MAPMKRPAAAAPGSPVKKLALPEGDAVSKQCRVIRDAVKSAEGVSSSLLDMLTCNLGASVGVDKDERHPFQARVVEMVAEVLNSMEKSLQEGINTEKSAVAAVDAEQSAKDSASTAASEEAKAKSEATSAAKTAMTEAGAALAAATKAVAAAEADKKAGDAEYASETAKKTKLETALNGTYQPLKDGSCDPSTKQASIDSLTKIGEEYGFDPSLLSSLPSALAKSADARGSFDTMCMSQVEEELTKQIGLLNEKLATLEKSLSDRAGAVEAAKSDLEEKKQVDQSSKDALEAAKAAEKEAKEAAAEAAKAANQHQSEVKKANAALSKAESKLSDLQEGALTDFKALKDGKIIDGHAYDRDILDAVKTAAVSGGQVSYAEARKIWSKAKEGAGITRCEKATLGHCMNSKAYTFTPKAINFLSVYLKAGQHGGYYKTVDGKKYDRALLEEAEKFAADGTISLKEAKLLFEDAQDGVGLTPTEKDTLRHALSSLTWTDVAKAYMEKQLKREHPASYYVQVDGKRYDKALLEEMTEYSEQGEGVSEAGANTLWEAAQDGKGITPTERATLNHGLKTLPFTEAARALLEAKLAGK